MSLEWMEVVTTARLPLSPLQAISAAWVVFYHVILWQSWFISNPEVSPDPYTSTSTSSYLLISPNASPPYHNISSEATTCLTRDFAVS